MFTGCASRKFWRGPVIFALKAKGCTTRRAPHGAAALRRPHGRVPVRHVTAIKGAFRGAPGTATNVIRRLANTFGNYLNRRPCGGRRLLDGKFGWAEVGAWCCPKR